MDAFGEHGDVDLVHALAALAITQAAAEHGAAVLHDLLSCISDRPAVQYDHEPVLVDLGLDDLRLQARERTAAMRARRCHAGRRRVVSMNLKGRLSQTGTAVMVRAIGPAVLGALAPDVLLYQEAPWVPPGVLSDAANFNVDLADRPLEVAWAPGGNRKEAGVAWDTTVMRRRCQLNKAWLSLPYDGIVLGPQHRGITLLHGLGVAANDDVFTNPAHGVAANAVLPVAVGAELQQYATPLAVALAILDRVCVVCLEDRATGRVMVFASAHGPYIGHNDASRGRFCALAVKLVTGYAAAHGATAVIGGDWNVAILEHAAVNNLISAPTHYWGNRANSRIDAIVTPVAARVMMDIVVAAPIYHQGAGGAWTLPRTGGEALIQLPTPPAHPLHDLWPTAAPIYQHNLATLGIDEDVIAQQPFGPNLFDHDPVMTDVFM